MNLFILHKNPRVCATYYFDSHVVKIILEAIQMLFVAKKILEPNADYEDLPLNAKGNPYKITHKNHPVSIWVRTSKGNWDWTCELLEALHDEWKYRYDHPKKKFHGAYPLYLWLKSHPPIFFLCETSRRTNFVRAMPDVYKNETSVIRSYKAYYQGPEKQKLRKWKKRSIPQWFNSK